MIIGLGMAAPYALLTSMPSLLKHLPKPGRWMEIFKQAMGFVLLVVAVWLATILPAGAANRSFVLCTDTGVLRVDVGRLGQL